MIRKKRAKVIGDEQTCEVNVYSGWNLKVRLNNRVCFSGIRVGFYFHMIEIISVLFASIESNSAKFCADFTVRTKERNPLNQEVGNFPCISLKSKKPAHVTLISRRNGIRLFNL